MRKRLLIVEDDPDIRGLLPQLFDHPDVTIDSAWDAISALGMAHANQPKAILLDLGLPDLEGVHALEHLRRLVPGVRIIIMTARPIPELMAAAQKYGAFALLPKPFEDCSRETVLRALDVDEDGAAAPRSDAP